jgi:hypothetical protein
MILFIRLWPQRAPLLLGSASQHVGGFADRYETRNQVWNQLCNQVWNQVWNQFALTGYETRYETRYETINCVEVWNRYETCPFTRVVSYPPKANLGHIYISIYIIFDRGGRGCHVLGRGRLRYQRLALPRHDRGSGALAGLGPRWASKSWAKMATLSLSFSLSISLYVYLFSFSFSGQGDSEDARRPLKHI